MGHDYAGRTNSLDLPLSVPPTRICSCPAASVGACVGLLKTCVRRDAGDVRYLEMAMKALAEIRDLFKIRAEAESKLTAASRRRTRA